jgi:two-component system nitrate/nitrite sensor histidine kinase NarX
VEACLTHEFTAPRSGDLKVLLNHFLQNMIGIANASEGMIRLVSPDGRTLQIIGSAGLPTGQQEPTDDCQEWECAAYRRTPDMQGMRTIDIRSCTFRPNCSHANCCFQSLISAPIEVSRAQSMPLGYLTLFFNAPVAKAVQTLNIVGSFVEMIAATVEHTLSNREAGRMERLAARQAIANDIHDSISQTLTYARMRTTLLLEAIRGNNQALAIKYAGDLDEALEASQKNARALITDFRTELNPGGLLAALHDLTAEFRKRSNIMLEYHNCLADLDLPLEHEIQAYQIVREALTNIARHSNATHARVFANASFGYYVFTIEDNGIGACAFTPVEGHYGMIIMRERAKRIGGEIRIASPAGVGTQIQLFFPEPASDWREAHESKTENRPG